MSKFKEAAASAKQDDNAQEVLSVAFASTPTSQKSASKDSAPLSKRAVKRVSVYFNPSYTLFSHAFTTLSCLTRGQIAKFEEMKAKRQKHKAAKARSIAARSAKKLQTKVGSASESDVAPTVGAPEKKLKLDRSSSRNLASQRPPPTKQRVGVLDEGRPKGQGRPPKEPKVTGAKTNSRLKLVDMGQKRKEVIIFHALTNTGNGKRTNSPLTAQS